MVLNLFSYSRKDVYLMLFCQSKPWRSHHFMLIADTASTWVKHLYYSNAHLNSRFQSYYFQWNHCAKIKSVRQLNWESRLIKLNVWYVIFRWFHINNIWSSSNFLICSQITHIYEEMSTLFLSNVNQSTNDIPDGKLQKVFHNFKSIDQNKSVQEGFPCDFWLD